MESKARRAELRSKSPQPVEDNYEAHKKNPGPSREAIEERDEDGAGSAMKWIIPVVIVILLIVWFVFFSDTSGRN